MKELYWLSVVVLAIVSCAPKDEEVQKAVIIETPSKIEEEKREGGVIQAEVKILPLKEEVTEIEIINSFFVSDDTIQHGFFDLLGTTEKWSSSLPIMFSANNNGKLLGAFDLNDSIKLIPFFIDRDMEVQIFTRWKTLTDSTFSYNGRLKPKLNSKYSLITILEKVNIDGDEYFIGKTAGGEGGEMWQSIWTGKYNGVDDFDTINQYETNSEDSEYSSTLSYELKEHSLSIILDIDSLVFNESSTIRIPISHELVKTVKLK